MSVFNPEEYRVKFRSIFAVIAFISGMLFVSLAVFSPTASESKFTGTIIGFICGTMITLVLTYYFGSSDGAGISPTPVNPEYDKLPENPAGDGTPAKKSRFLNKKEE